MGWLCSLVVIISTGGFKNQVTVFACVFQKCNVCHMNSTLVFDSVEKLLAKEHRLYLLAWSTFVKFAKLKVLCNIFRCFLSMHAGGKNDPVELRSTLHVLGTVLHASQVFGPPAALRLHPVQAPDCGEQHKCTGCCFFLRQVLHRSVTRGRSWGVGGLVLGVGWGTCAYSRKKKKCSPVINKWVNTPPLTGREEDQVYPA